LVTNQKSISVIEDGEVICRNIFGKKKLGYTLSSIHIKHLNIFLTATSENHFLVISPTSLSVLETLPYSSASRAVFFLVYDEVGERVISGGIDGIHIWKVIRTRIATGSKYSLEHIPLPTMEVVGGEKLPISSWVSWMDCDLVNGVLNLIIENHAVALNFPSLQPLGIIPPSTDVPISRIQYVKPLQLFLVADSLGGVTVFISQSTSSVHQKPLLPKFSVLQSLLLHGDRITGLFLDPACEAFVSYSKDRTIRAVDLGDFSVISGEEERCDSIPLNFWRSGNNKKMTVAGYFQDGTLGQFNYTAVGNKYRVSSSEIVSIRKCTPYNTLTSIMDLSSMVAEGSTTYLKNQVHPKLVEESRTGISIFSLEDHRLLSKMDSFVLEIEGFEMSVCHDLLFILLREGDIQVYDTRNEQTTLIENISTLPDPEDDKVTFIKLIGSMARTDIIDEEKEDDVHLNFRFEVASPLHSLPEILVCGMESGIIILLDVNQGGRQISIVDAHSSHVSFISYLHREKFVLTGGLDEGGSATVSVWRLPAFHKACEFQLTPNDGKVSYISISDVSLLLAVGTDLGRVKVADMFGADLTTLYLKDQPLHYEDTHSSAITSINFFPSSYLSQTFLSSSLDGVICIWDYDLNPVRVISYPHPIFDTGTLINNSILLTQRNNSIHIPRHTWGKSYHQVKRQHTSIHDAGIKEKQLQNNQ